MATPTISYVPAEFGVVGLPAYSATGTYATASGVVPPVQFGSAVRFRDVQTGSSRAGGCVAVFCRGSNVSSAGQFVQIINGSAVALTVGNSLSDFPLGIAGGALSATSVWGWVGIQGKFDNGAYTNLECAANARMYLPTETAGQVQTSASAANAYIEIRGINAPNSFTSADGSAAAVGYRALTVQLARPYLLMRSDTDAAW
jgi:hypothetical protein